MKLFCLLLSLLSGIQSCLSQEPPPVMQQQLEDLADATETEMDDDEYLIRLDQFKKHPIDINTATEEDLQALTLLTDLQIDQLIHYRSILGKLLNLYELQAVPLWDVVSIRKVIRYLTISDALSLKENFHARLKGDQSLLLRLSRRIEPLKEYDTSLNNHFLGDPNHLLSRYRFQYKNLFYFGFTADKDPGEQFFKGSHSKGFDFYSVHFFLKDIGHIKALAIGDYSVNLGQGLIQWQTMATGKSADVISIKRQSPVLMPYRSAGEFNFNRGFGITWQKKNLEMSFFLSHKKISGNVSTDSIRNFTTMLVSGYHRSASEIADRNMIRLNVLGTCLRYSVSGFKMSFNAIANQFDIPLQKIGEPYKLYAATGKQFFNASVDYGYSFRNMHVFGEMATDQTLHKAFITGILMSVDPKIDLSFLYRQIEPAYQALFANAFTENTLPVNETGYYIGIAIHPGSSWQLHAYSDFYRFPWLKYRTNAPSGGFDYLIQLNYQPGKKYSIYLRYRNKNKPLNASENPIYSPSNQIKESLRLHFSTQLTRSFALKARWETALFNKKEEKSEEGFLGFVEGSWQPMSRLSADIRFQYFETGGYNSRLYAYESDVLYSFSIPAFFDKGLRYYLNLNCRAGKRFSFWLRWSQTINRSQRLNQDLNSSINNSEIKLQSQIIF